MLVSNLDVIIGLLEIPLPEGSTICVSRTVIRELDSLKTKLAGARSAIRFLQATTNFVRMQIEGIENENRMESESELLGKIKEQNNDDQIINYIFKQENAVLLTNDVAFALRCNTYSIKSIEVKGKSAGEIAREILVYFEMEMPGLVEEPEQECSLQTLKLTVKLAIESRIKEITIKELGPESDIIFERMSCLEDYIHHIIRNYFIFQRHLPKKSRKILQNYSTELKNGNYEIIYDQSKGICKLFDVKLQINQDTDIR